MAQYTQSIPPQAALLQKIGLYTSPHLRYVRERIQINNEPLSEEIFTQYFFETWDRIDAWALKNGESTDVSNKPAYFRFLTLMAFHTFMSEGVDTAVIECGIGGELDHTNVLVSPSCTGVTSLGIDHTALLGNTIEEIAWQKGGIFKAGAPAFTAPQPVSALKVLQDRADVIPTTLKVVERNDKIDHVQLGLAGDFQKINASLAAAIVAQHLQNIGGPPTSSEAPLPPEFIQGLQKTQLAGRCDTRKSGRLTYFLDCAHTMESMEVAVEWFSSQVRSSKSSVRILLFNQQTRDANLLVRTLHQKLRANLSNEHPFSHVVFCTNLTTIASGYKPDLKSINTDANIVERLEVQKALAEAWMGIDPQTDVAIVKSIEEAVAWCQQVAKVNNQNATVFVTGSVHLVGGVLDVLETS